MKYQFYRVPLLLLSVGLGFLTPSARRISPLELPAAALEASAMPAIGAGFHAVATFRVKGKVAEIVAATPDGRTLCYTDSVAHQIGFVDITNPARPRQTGILKVAGEPTSIAITPNGRWLLCVVHGAPDHLLVIDFKSRKIRRKMTLCGQPDCVAISGDGRYAAVAIENERQKQKSPMPQNPSGSLTIVDIRGAPAEWKLRDVKLTGLATRFAADPEPEFIAINSKNQAAVTLQENNHIVLIDLAAGRVLRHWTAGATSHAADLKMDGKIAFSDRLINARREPDAIAWTAGGNLITANEGDYDLDLKERQYSGGRNWTVFSPTGKILHDDTQLESAVARAGSYPDERSIKSGVEPESVATARFRNRNLTFIGCERANCVAVYDLERERSARLLQILPTGAKPEGLLAIPRRSLLVTANEGDGTLSIFRCDSR